MNMQEKKKSSKMLLYTAEIPRKNRTYETSDSLKNLEVNLTESIEKKRKPRSKKI